MNAAALPKQVQQQVEEAERIEQELAAPPPPEDPNEVIEAETPETRQPAAAKEVTAPVADEAAKKEAEYWKQRFQTIEGKYNAEVPRMAEQIKQSQESLRAMQEQLTRQAQPKPKAQPLVTEKDEQTFGSDLIDAMRRVAQESTRDVEASVRALAQQVADFTSQFQRVQRVETEVANSRQDAFWAALVAAIPNWEEINKDAKWLAWLEEFDAIAGATRQEALNIAANALDHKRVIAIFKAFTGAQAQPSAPSSQKSELARQVTPPRSSRTTPAQQSAKTFTGKDYTYWTDPRRVHDQKPEVLQSMLNELETAQAEGRIRW